jgi:hypothetical protein
MLPDFPELKRKLARLQSVRMKHVHRSSSLPLSKVGVFCVAEGNRVMLVDENKVESEIPMKQHRTTIKISDEEVESLTPEQILERFDEAARDLAGQSDRTFFESLDRSIESVGNAVEYKGKVTADDFLKMLDTVSIDFDDHGNPQMPTLLCGKDVFAQVVELKSDTEDDPEFTRRYESLLTKKYEEWRDRESRRKLVE